MIVKTGKKSSLGCQEAYFFGNTEIMHVEIFLEHGTHTLTFKTGTDVAREDMAFGGIKVFEFCDSFVDEVKSFINTIPLAIGGLSDHPFVPYVGTHVPPYMERANVEFLGEAMGWHLEPREIKNVKIDKSLVHDGDFIAIMRLDGLDPLIMYGTGGHVGHSTMALHFDGELYIVESQDAWYWPTSGLQRTPWDLWMKRAEDASFHVSWLPLSDEARAAFDSDAAREFYFETEGLPYGYHNFLFGWLDTPSDNLPGLMPNEFLPILGAILEMIVPKFIFTTVGEALNIRLGTKDLTIPELAAEAASQGMSLQDVMAIPEQDGWIYYGEEPRDGLSYVCSAYVAALYKAAGLFGDMPINATEFHPRDVYSLAFFNDTFDRP